MHDGRPSPATIRDVAKRAGVSTATVSRVLAGIGNPKAETSDAVMAAVEALDYRFCRNAHAGRDAQIQPALILLDLKLPKVDGLDVLREIRANPSTQLLRVVILTSSKEEQDLINGYRLGANSYIRKPVDFGQFMEAVRQLGLYWLVLNETPPDKVQA